MTIVRVIGNADFAMKKEICRGGGENIGEKKLIATSAVDTRGEGEKPPPHIRGTREYRRESPLCLGRLNQKTRKKGEVKTNLFNLLSSVIL